MKFKFLKKLKSHRLSKIRHFILSNDEYYVLSVFLIVNLFLLTRVIGASPWTTIAFFVLVAAFLWLRLHDLTLSFLLVSIFSFQFYVPNKYYVIEIFRPFELQNGVGAYRLGYGVNLENIFLIITVVLIARNLILKKTKNSRSEAPFLVPIALSGLLYFLISLYSSLRFSPYFVLSFIWLLQYMQLFLVGFSVFYISKTNQKTLKLISPVFLASLALQSIIAIFEFVKQTWVGLPIESARGDSIYFGGPDAVDSLFRVTGTFAHSNQFALLMVVMLVLVLPQTLLKKQKTYMAVALVALAGILLTQSRSGWLALSAISVTAFIMYKKELSKLVSFLGLRRTYISIALIIFATAMVVISRLLVSLNAFEKGASVALRLEMAKEASMAISQNPLIGYGIGTNERVLYNLFPKGYNYTFPAPVHVGYLQLILESGILGFIAFVFPFLFIICSIVKHYFVFGIRKMAKVKNYVFITLGGIMAFAMYYITQPLEGYREFAYLGLILGYGLICLHELRKTI